MMKRLLLTALCVALALAVPVAHCEGARYEGEGFSSPEEVVEAYVAAFNAGDVQGMLSTFAIETYADHMDQRAFARRIRAFLFTSNNCFPVIDEYSRGLLVAGRVGELANTLKYQFLTYAWPSDYGAFDGTMTTFGAEDTEGEVDRFYEGFEGSGFSDWFGHIELVGFVTLEELQVDQLYNSEKSLETIDRVRACYGCDELVDRAARLSVAGEDCVQFLQCARYGDKWYAFSTTGHLPNLLGLSVYNGGLIRLSDVSR